MLKKLFFALLWLVALLALAAGCWLLSLYQDWPLWSVPLLFLGALLIIALGLWLRRRWIAWRLRRRLARDMSQPVRSAGHPELDALWKSGVQSLSQSRLGRSGNPMYALPWLMVLDAVGPTRATRRTSLLTHTRLATHRGATIAAPEDTASVLNWFFLRNSVVLEPGARVIDDSADAAGSEWQRLLYWMLRTRRREPINGVVLTLDAAWIGTANDAELADAGRRLRSRLDDLTRIYDARLPVWLLITGSQIVPGMIEWGNLLDETLRDQAFGYTDDQGQRGNQHGASEFLPLAFDAIARRLFELRIAQGLQGQSGALAFELPQRIADLQPRLARVLTPAFDATPYAETPLLRGLYFSAEVPGNGATATWFTRQLFDEVLPAQRYHWIPLERLRQWRRLLRHAAVVGWLAFCAAIAGVLLYSWRDTHTHLEQLAARPLDKLDFSGGIESDLQALNVWRSINLRVNGQDLRWQRWLPFNRHLSAVEASYERDYVRVFNREVLTYFINPFAARNLPEVAQRGSDRQVAAWTQFLVRRINMVRAALDGGDVFALPAPGRDLAVLFESERNNRIGDETQVLLGQLYAYYLHWQTEPAQLRAELDVLTSDLARLGLERRSPSWLLAWADFQGGLQPVTLGNFWPIAHGPDMPRVPAGLTDAGAQAINEFAEELSRAVGKEGVLKNAFAQYQRRYREAAYDAWFRFATGFGEARQLLPDSAAWTGVLASLFTPRDPHLALLHTMALAFENLGAEDRPNWANRVVELDRLFASANRGNPPSALGMLDKARVANAVGGAQLRELSTASGVPQAIGQVRHSLDAMQNIEQYRTDVLEAVTTMLQGEGSARQVASDTWAYGHDPAVKTAPLWTASEQFTQARSRMAGAGAREDVVWNLVRGPLTFSVDYAGRSAACRFQQDWESSVLSAVQNVTDTALANELLYGERGQVPAFMSGPIQNFVNRTAVRYEPRFALGQTIPLNGQFFAFVSNVQLKQVASAAARKSDELAGQERTLAIQTLEQQAADVDKQLAAAQTAGASVVIEGLPPLLNPGARALPQRTSLTLQCAGNPVTLENYNFPSRAVFNWTPTTCGDTSIQVQFPTFTLDKQYPGPRGFLDFLRDFASGQRTFTPADFPQRQAAMEQAGVESISITWRQQGQQALLQSFATADKLTASAARIRKELDTLKAQAVVRPDPLAPTVLASDSVPARIVNTCWQPIAQPGPATPPPRAGAAAGLSMPLGGTAGGHTTRATPARGQGHAHAHAPQAAAAPAAPQGTGTGAAASPDASTTAAPVSDLRRIPSGNLPIPLPPGVAIPPAPATSSSTKAPAPAQSTQRDPAGSAPAGQEANAAATPAALADTPASAPATRINPPAAATPATPTASAPPPATNAATDGWAVQVGVFSDPTDARQKLDAAGFRYTLQPITRRDGRTVQRLRVEGFPDREAALQAANRIDAQLRVTTELIAPGR